MEDNNTVTAPSDARFLMTLGKCVTDWARIEEQLFYMLQDMLGITKEQCAIIYYRTPTLETRLQLVDEVLLDVFPKPQRRNGGHPHTDVKTWQFLLKDIRDELPVRNRLAHNPVGWGIYAKTDERGQVTDVKIDVHSYPAHTEIARASSSEKEPLTLADLEKYERRILALHNRLNAFRQTEAKAQLAARAQRASESKTAPIDPWRGPDG
jgi:hypothetical protein